MNLSTMDVEKAVFRIFRRLRIPAGGQLRQAMLVKEWTHTSLRRRDLDACLKRLTAMCYLNTERSPEGEVLVLTPIGHDYMEELLKGPFHDLRQRLRLRWAALIRRSPDIDVVRPPPRRRLSDRVTPTLQA
jgi:hypothetical protein